jgi:hypothetical protein
VSRVRPAPPIALLTEAFERLVEPTASPCRSTITSRPYRAGMTPGAALEELRRGAGAQFDAALVECFAGARAALVR